MIRAARRLDLASEVLLFVLVVGTPLAFGAVEVWATEAMKWGIALFVLLRVCRAVVHHRSGFPWPRLSGTGLALPAALFVGVILLQATPLPRTALRLLSPSADALYGRTLPGWPAGENLAEVESYLLGAPSKPLAIAGDGTRAPAARRWRTLSIYPYGTRERFALLGAYLLLFFAAIDFARSPRRRMRLLMGVTLSGFLIAAFGLVQKMTWNGKIFWIRKAPANTIPFGPFINPDHFAGYMELVLPVSVGLLLMVWRVRRSPSLPEDVVVERGVGSIAFPRLEKETHQLFSGWGDEAISKTAVVSCALAMAVTAILVSRSVGALFATGLTFALFGALLVPLRHRRKVAFGGTCVLVGGVLAALLGWWGMGPLAEPLRRVTDVGSAPSFAMRWMTWVRVGDMIADFPLFGTGLGSFGLAYARYYPAGVYGLWTHAHNDWLQLVAETGLAGTAAFLGGLAGYGRRIFLPALARGGDQELRLGVAMALVSMALHSFVDFNLQIPSNGLLTVLLGAVLAAAVIRRGEEESPLDPASGADPLGEGM